MNDNLPDGKYLNIGTFRVSTLVLNLEDLEDEKEFINLFIKGLEIGYRSFHLGKNNINFLFKNKEIEEKVKNLNEKIEQNVKNEESEKKEQNKTNEQNEKIVIFIEINNDNILEIIKNNNSTKKEQFNFCCLLNHDKVYEKQKKVNIIYGQYNGSTLPDDKDILINKVEFNPFFFKDLPKKTLSKSIFCGNNELLLHNKILKKISEKYKKSVYQILIKWNIQKENCVLIKTTEEKFLKEDFDVFGFKLGQKEMEKINSLKNEFNLIKFEKDFKKRKYIKCLNGNCPFPVLIKFKYNNKIIVSCRANHENEYNSLKDYFLEYNNKKTIFICNECKNSLYESEEKKYCNICDNYFHDNNKECLHYHYLFYPIGILNLCPFHYQKIQSFYKSDTGFEKGICKECIEQFNIQKQEEFHFLDEKEESLLNFLKNCDLIICQNEKYLIEQYFYFKNEKIENFEVIQSAKNLLSIYPKIIGDFYFAESQKVQRSQFRDNINQNTILFFIINNDEYITYDQGSNVKLFAFKENTDFQETINYGNYNLKNILFEKNSLIILTKEKYIIFNDYLNKENKEEKNYKDIIYASNSILVEDTLENKIDIKEKDENNGFITKVPIRNKTLEDFIMIYDKNNENNMINENNGDLSFLYYYKKDSFTFNFTFQNFKSFNFINNKKTESIFQRIIPYNCNVIFFLTYDFDIYYWKLDDKENDDFRIFKTSDEVFELCKTCKNIFLSGQHLVLYTPEGIHSEFYIPISDLITS